MRKIQLLPVVLLFGVNACKNTVPEPASTAARPTLTDTNWQLAGYLYDATNRGNGATTKIDYYTRLGCKKDDLFTFSTDNKLRWNPNVLLCQGESAAATEWATWKMVADNSQLILDRNGANYFPFNRNGSSSLVPSFTVTKLTTAEMVLQSLVTRAPIP